MSHLKSQNANTVASVRNLHTIAEHRDGDLFTDLAIGVGFGSLVAIGVGWFVFDRMVAFIASGIWMAFGIVEIPYS